MVSLNPHGCAVLAAVAEHKVYRVESEQAHGLPYQSYRSGIHRPGRAGNVTRTVRLLADKVDPPLIRPANAIVGNRREWVITPDGEQVLAALGGRP
jgi:hypothetical protein